MPDPTLVVLSGIIGSTIVPFVVNLVKHRTDDPDVLQGAAIAVSLLIAVVEYLLAGGSFADGTAAFVALAGSAELAYQKYWRQSGLLDRVTGVQGDLEGEPEDDEFFLAEGNE